MPTSETGNKTAGYTLLEIVAVIALIGLILALTYPNIDRSVERVEVGFIGRLIKSDFKQIKEESLIEPDQEMTVAFVKDGYSVTIGNHQITRSFKYQFAFDLPEPAPVDQEADQEVNRENEAAQNEETAVSDEASGLLKILNGELTGGELKLNWQTANFQGSLSVNKDGTAEWSYEKK